MTIFKVSYMKWELAQMDRHWTVNTKVLVGKPFAEINLPFTMKQYKNSPIRGRGGLSKMSKKMSKMSIIELSRLGQDLFDFSDLT